MKPTIDHADVAVVGGGPVGALAALGLTRAGRKVVLVETRARRAPVHDARALALSWASRQRLEEEGAWPATLPATPIDVVHVSQQGACGRTVLSREDLGLPHLGLVADYAALTAALNARLEEAGVTVLWESRVTAVKSLARYAALEVESAGQRAALTCRLAVLAEGGALAETLSGIRRSVHDYRQCALLAPVTFEAPQTGTAYERFSLEGPFALLPYGDGYMLVWTRSPEEAAALSGDADMLKVAIERAMGGRLGAVTHTGPCAVFPLVLKEVNRVVSGRVVLIGNAAQTMHPVAAQGLNLGLRDASGLIEAVAGSPDPGSPEVLSGYAARRRLDSRAVVGFTHSLIQLFDGHDALSQWLRGTGMNLLDVVPPLRRAFASHLVFGVGQR
ncbi:FAD-dependent monooxygenase [Gulbenkiania mobilis]|uniref:FAD-dependent monooxygenase n=1 Tax=Gulbenkiania mobilis TaxID=397457 RepID=UPI0006BBCB4E|nr:FAD-dependent monooxygenase [Gulbenkiania mobilis]